MLPAGDQARHIKTCKYIFKILIPHPLFFHMKHIIRHHKVAASHGEIPSDEDISHSPVNSPAINQDTEYGKLVAELGMEELHELELDTEKFEVSVLAAKRASLEAYRVRVEPLYEKSSGSDSSFGEKVRTGGVIRRVVPVNTVRWEGRKKKVMTPMRTFSPEEESLPLLTNTHFKRSTFVLLLTLKPISSSSASSSCPPPPAASSSFPSSITSFPPSNSLDKAANPFFTASRLLT
ncbi:hypothetical protein OROMI_023053 [Orobanche minor]